MGNYSRKILMMTFAGATAVLTLTGCGDTGSQATSVTIDKEGKVANEIYENFDQEYYDLQGLEDMAASEISEYNVEYDAPKVSLDKVELLEDATLAKLSMTYDSPSDYSHFNQVVLFYGTVEEARDRGYEVSGNLVDADGNKIDPEVLEGSGEKHIIITSEKININAPFNIEYMSKGAVLKGKKEADLSEVNTDTATLLLSK